MNRFVTRAARLARYTVPRCRAPSYHRHKIKNPNPRRGILRGSPARPQPGSPQPGDCPASPYSCPSVVALSRTRSHSAAGASLSNNHHLTGGLGRLRGCTGLQRLRLQPIKVHLTGGLEPLRGCTALLRQRTRRSHRHCAHTVGRHADVPLSGLCTPPRAVGHVAARWPRVPPVGWLHGGRSLKQTKAENNVGVPHKPQPTPPRKRQKVRVYSFVS